MNDWLFVAGVLAGMFVIGGVPFGYLAGRVKGIDIRTMGSGNIGATNVFRVMGRKWGTLVFALDFMKAFVPLLLLAHGLADGRPWPLPSDLLLILAGICAVAGHNHSIFLGFKGGKGMATSAGLLLALLPWPALCCIGAWVIVFFFSRYVSAASIAAAATLPVWTFLLGGHTWLLGASILLGAMAVWRHRSNIQRLREGTEPRFGRPAPGPEDAGGSAEAPEETP